MGIHSLDACIQCTRIDYFFRAIWIHNFYGVIIFLFVKRITLRRRATV